MAFFYQFVLWAGYSLLCLLILSLIGFLCYCVYIKHIHMKYDHIPGPPRDSFLLGHSPILQRATLHFTNVHDIFLEWAEIYGPVCRINSLHYVILLVTCPETTKEILMSAEYPKSKVMYGRLSSLFGTRFLGNGLVTSQNHEQWYRQRRIMDPAFRSLYLQGLMGNFNERAERLMEKLTELADSKTEAKMLHLFNHVTLDVITKVAFGMDLNMLQSPDSPFPKAIQICLKGLVIYTRDTFFQLCPKNRPFIKEVREACNFLRATGAKWISDRRAAIHNGEDVPKDILTQIIKTASKEEDKNEYDEELMLDNFVTFFIADAITTLQDRKRLLTNLLSASWNWEDIRIFWQMKKEVDSVIGMKQEISYDDLGSMTYLSQILKETLRMYPPAPSTSRDVAKHMVIDGIHISGGVICKFDTYITGRMEKFFKDPLMFDPDRFHPDAPKPYYCYYPFLLGPRSCLGQKFSQMEAKVVMAKLLQRFDFTLVPGQSFCIMDMGTLRPKSSVVCMIKHRSPN